MVEIEQSYPVRLTARLPEAFFLQERKRLICACPCESGLGLTVKPYQLSCEEETR